MDWRAPDTDPTPYEIYRRGPRTRSRTVMIGVALGVVGIVAIAVGLGLVLLSGGDPDPGRTSEQLFVWEPVSGPVPPLVDATAAWGLDTWQHTGTTQVSGGVAIGDIDSDGRPDVVAGGGSLAIFFGTETGTFEQVSGVVAELASEVTAVALADVDSDEAVDILVGTATGTDLVVWGGAWASRRDLAGVEVTELPGGTPTTGLLVADFSADGLRDVVRLGYGPPDGSPTADVLFLRQPERRTFEPLELPSSKRRSLAAEIADIDGDGLVDIWVSRDVGWQSGGNSIYSRRDRAEGPWHDIASGVGADQEIDGMGVTLADLTGDGSLDAYLTDVGDNEVLTRLGDGYEPKLDSGAGRIRPPDGEPTSVSSSWGSGVADLNLDGRLDLLVVNGGFPGLFNKIENTEVLVSDPPALFLGIGDGRFADVWSQLGLPWNGSSRGLALGDLDVDGDTDVLIVNHRQGIIALRNDMEGPTVTARPEEDCDPAGAVVSVILPGGTVTGLLAAHSFLGSHAAELIVGVGASPSVVIEVGFPGAEITVLEEVIDPDEPRLVVEVPCP